MKKILIPVDASENSKRAVEQGKLLAKTFGSDVVLLNVINISYFYFNYDANVPQISLLTIIEEEKKHSQELLDGYKASFGEMADKVETIVLQGATANEILEYSHKCEVDLIVMGSRGVGSAMKVALMGSVANKVLHNSDKPVLIVK